MVLTWPLPVLLQPAGRQVYTLFPKEITLCIEYSGACVVYARAVGAFFCLLFGGGFITLFLFEFRFPPPFACVSGREGRFFLF